MTTISKFLQIGTGAVNRDFPEKLYETVSVLDFGADPTGATDSTEAIQHAIDRALSQNTTCYFPSGIYKITSALTISPVSGYGVGVILQGAGMGSVIKAVGFSGNVITCNASTPVFQGTQVVINNLRFLNADGTPNSFIYNQEGVNLKINDCKFITVSATTACVINKHGYGLSLKNCIFNGITGDAVFLQQNVDESIAYSFVVAFEGCDFSTITGKAVSMQGANVLLLQNTIMQMCNYGLYIDPVTAGTVAFNIRVVSCWFEKNTTSDIELLSNASSWCEADIQRCQFGGFSPANKAHIKLGAKSRIFVTGTPSGNTVDVTGSASAAFYGIGTKPKFNKVGTFFWSEYDYAGGYNTPLINTDASGNIIANAGAFITSTESITVPTGVATALFVLPSDTDAVYMISTSAGTAGPAYWTVVGLISCSNNIGRLTMLQTSTHLTLSLSGLTINGAQTATPSIPVNVTVTRIQ